MNYSDDSRVEALQTKSRILTSKIEGIITGTSVLMWIMIIISALGIIALFMNDAEDKSGIFFVTIATSVSFMLLVKAVGGFMVFMIENGMNQTIIMNEIRCGMSDTKKANIPSVNNTAIAKTEIKYDEELPEL